MEIKREELARIKDVLRANPKGMNVSEIAKEIGINRITAAKYLEMLVISGHVDMKAFGPAKVYYLSQRMPISAMLSLSSEFIIILDSSLSIMNVNDRFLEFAHIDRGTILYKKIEHFSFMTKFDPQIFPNIKDALGGKESIVEAEFEQGGNAYYFNIKLIPVVFEDGDKGVTIFIENITQRKQIELAIRESEQKFRSVIEQSSDGILLFDKNGVIIEYSKGMELITGLKPENCIGKLLWETDFIKHVEGKFFSEYRSEKGLRSLKEFILEYTRTGESPLGISSFEMIFTKPDNEKKIVQFNYFPIRFENGNMLCAIARDITELKKKEKELAYSEEKFRTLTETAAAGILIFDDYRLIYANPAAENITGFLAEELLKVNIFELFHPDYKDRVRHHLQPISHSNGSKAPEHKSRFEAKILKRSGKEAWVDITIGVLDFEGSVANMVTIFDITERKKAEEAQRESEEQFREIFEQAAIGIAYVDVDRKFVQVNNKFCEIVGYRPDELTSMTFLDITHPEYLAVSKEQHQKLIDHKVPSYTMEKKYVKKDGTSVWANITISRVHRSESSSYAILIVEDITERKHMEERLKSLYDELEERVKERTMQLEIMNKALSSEITHHIEMETKLRENEEKYRSLVENISDGVWETDKNVVFTYMSPRIYDILGFTPEEVIGKTPFNLMMRDEANRVGLLVREKLEKERSFTLIECMLVHKDGHSVYVELSGTPIIDRSGAVIGYRGMTRDITKRKSA